MWQIPKSLEKKIFYILAGIFLVIMPVLSLQSGISGDEETYHYPHGKNVYNYYKTFGKDTTCLYYDNSVLHMYGPVFDLTTVAVIHIFNAEDEYQVRHILNSIAGWAALFCVGLIVVMLVGWKAGILAMIFMFLSPRFLGHAFNNPKDIPFMAAYIFTIYAIIRYLKHYPEKPLKYAWPVALGIGLSIGVRVGGLLLAVYFMFFTGMHYVFTHQAKLWFQKENLRKLGISLLWAGGISIVGYLIGILLWPYAHQAPVERTINALKYMEQYATSPKQLFEGNIIWGDNVPWYYLPKYIFMTIPEFIIAGIVLFFIFIKQLKKANTSWYFVLLFVSVFPVVYIILKESNVYGGWRHVSFIYPGLVAIAAIGVSKLFDIINQKYVKLGSLAILLFLLFLPLRHIVANHPLEYIYYNTISGGVENAYARYEMDYFYHSLRPASDWLIENRLQKMDIPDGEEIIVASNHSDIARYYFRHMEDKVSVRYIRYYERGNSDWDFAVLANSYINPGQLKRRIWPPENTIHTVDLDGKPAGIVLERKTKADLQGWRYMKEGNYPLAITYFTEAIKAMPKYEMMYYNRAQCYMQLKQYDQAIKDAKQCLRYYPEYSNALNMMGMAYLNKRDLNNAMQTFRRNMQLNPRDVPSHYYMGVIYAENGDLETARKYLEETIALNGRYKPAYYMMSRILQMQGNEAGAKQFLDAANSIK